MDAYAHGSYLSAKAWNSRVLLEWLNEAALRAATNDLPIGDTRLHKKHVKKIGSSVNCLLNYLLSFSLSLSQLRIVRWESGFRMKCKLGDETGLLTHC